MRCLPGRVAVAMDYVQERNGVLLPVSGRISPDTGTVISSGTSKLCRDENGYDYSEEAPPRAGARVLVMPYHGMYYEDAGQDIRILGVAESWTNSIPAVLINDEVQPLCDWILMERLKGYTTNLELPDSMKRFSEWGKVLGIGPNARLRLGSDIAFNSKHLVTFKFSARDEHALIRSSHVLAVKHA